jgi:thioredoxin-like negative regulator of GroEL
MSRVKAELKTALQVFLSLAMLCASAAYPEQESSASFDELSIQYRTALYNDPLLGSALDSLVELYLKADRLGELVGTYQSHIEQYPTDPGAKTVLIQVMQSAGRTGYEELLTSSVALHPDYAPLQYILFLALDAKGDERAIDVLSLAVDLEPRPQRRSEWLELLLERSGLEGRREVAESQLKNILEAEAMTFEESMSLARLTQRYQFWEVSMDALDRASEEGAESEDSVEISMRLAKALVGLNRREDAGKALDTLLQKLGPNHWRRREIMSMRLNVVASNDERRELIERYQKQYQDNPASEGAILDYADVLIASELQDEATRLLLKQAAELPDSKLIEDRVIELLRYAQDPKAYESFLQERLELRSERRELRLELVKIKFLLGKDADADQDFQTATAGMTPEESSREILDLQRYLRSIERKDAASPYLGQYLRRHPDRLDVARELIEIRLSTGERAAVEGLVDSLDSASAAPENIADLVEYLLSEDLVSGARAILVRRLEKTPDDFTLGLLLIQVLGELGDRQSVDRHINLMRDKADSPEKYAAWLDVSMKAQSRLELLSSFLKTEQQRFSFAEGEWSDDKAEKFLTLCEGAKSRLSNENIIAFIKERLAADGLSGPLKTRLQSFLLGLLEYSPESSREAVALLTDLAKMSPDAAPGYDLRRALVYHRSQEIGKAQNLIEQIDADQIIHVNALREAVEVLLNYRFLDQAVDFLARINELEPEDVFSWSRRLSLLATKGEESEFREVTRGLIQGDKGVRLHPNSVSHLNSQLIQSYWRSLARLFSSNQIEGTLPLLSSIEREVQPLEQRAWVEWARFVVLAKLGRQPEADAARERFAEIVANGKLRELRFPDGLSLEVSAATNFQLGSTPSSDDRGPAETGFLASKTELRWGFEIPEGSRIQTFWKGKERVLVVDDFNSVYGIESREGRLLWKKPGLSKRGKKRGRPPSFRESPFGAGLDSYSVSPGDRARLVHGFAASDRRFFLVEQGRLNCYSTIDGALIWSSEIPVLPRSTGSSGDDSNVIVVSDKMAIVFLPQLQAAASYELNGGKLRWLHQPKIAETRSSGVNSLNSGAQISNGRVLLYGAEVEILNAETGKQIWSLDPGNLSVLPVDLKRDRGEELLEGENLTESLDMTSIEVFDAINSIPELSTTLFFESREIGAIVSPAAYWAFRRIESPEPSFAHLGREHLWLGHGDVIRKIPTDIPLGGDQLKGAGAFLGESGSHGWFIEEGLLYHTDFVRRRTYTVEVADLGAEDTIRALMVGSQLVARGTRGFKVINALTGRVVGQADWSEDVMDYLASSGVDLSPSSGDSFLTWRGRITTSGPGASLICRPLNDIAQDGVYLTSFQERVLICLEAAREGAVETVQPDLDVEKR